MVRTYITCKFYGFKNLNTSSIGFFHSFVLHIQSILNKERTQDIIQAFLALSKQNDIRDVIQSNRKLLFDLSTYYF